MRSCARVLGLLLVAVGVVAAPRLATAQSCGCNKTIGVYNGPGYQTTDLSTVQPGQTVCIMAGSRNAAMVLNDVNGTAAQPILIKNCGGLVDIVAANGAGMQIRGTHFRFAGIGDPTIEKGIHIKSTYSGNNAMQIVGKLTDIEIDHVEITGAPYAGLMAKIDMGGECQADLARPSSTFLIENIALHDLDIHDTLTGEGIYLGDSFYTGSDVYNSGSSACPKGKKQYPIPLRHVRVFNVHTRNTGREGIQVGGADDDVDIYDNLVELYGQDDFDSSQNGGIQVGVGTTGKLRNNVVLGGPGVALVIQGIGANLVANNIVAGAGSQAISINTRPTPLATDIVNQTYRGGVYVIGNTLIDTNGKGAIVEYENGAPSNVLYNNFIVTALTGTTWDKRRTDTAWTSSHNVIAATTAAAKFTNAASNDYHLAAGSPALGNWFDVSSYGVVVDADGVARAVGGAVGAYEYVEPGADLASAPGVDLASASGVDLASASSVDAGATAEPDLASPPSDTDLGLADLARDDGHDDLTGAGQGHDKSGCNASGADASTTLVGLWVAMSVGLLLRGLRRLRKRG